MASGFQGFLKGFAVGGAKIIEDQDKDKRAQDLFIAERIAQNEIDAKYQGMVKETRAKAEADAVLGSKKTPATTAMDPQNVPASDPIQVADLGAPSDFNSAISGNESSYGVNLKNPTSSASGTHGVMNATAADPGFGVAPAKDGSMTEKNRVGSQYADAMLSKYKGNPIFASLAHYKGPGFVDNWIAAGADPTRLPPDARQYVGDAVLRIATGNAAGGPQGAPTPAQSPASDILNAPISPEERALAQSSLPLESPSRTNEQALNAIVLEKRKQDAIKAEERQAEMDYKNSKTAEAERARLASTPMAKAEAATIEKVATSAYEARESLESRLVDLDQFEEANNNKWSIFGPNWSESAQTLARAKAEGALKFVQYTKGSISDAEMKLFGQSTISPDNRASVNQSLINAARAVAIRQAQMADFLDAYNGEPKDAIAAFRRFSNENKIIAQKDGNIFLTKNLEDVAKDKSYLNYIDPNYKKSTKEGSSASTPAPTEASSTTQSLRQKLKLDTNND